MKLSVVINTVLENWVQALRVGSLSNGPSKRSWDSTLTQVMTASFFILFCLRCIFHKSKYQSKLHNLRSQTVWLNKPVINQFHIHCAYYEAENLNRNAAFIYTISDLTTFVVKLNLKYSLFYATAFKLQDTRVNSYKSYPNRRRRKIHYIHNFSRKPQRLKRRKERKY